MKEVRNDPKLVKKARRNRKGPYPNVPLFKIVVSITVLAGLFALFSQDWGKDEELIEEIYRSGPSVIEPEFSDSVSDSILVAYGPTNPFSWSDIVIRSGDTVFGALMAHDILRAEANKVVGALSTVFDVRKVRPDDKFSLQFFDLTTVVRVLYSPTPLIEIELTPYANGLTATRRELEPEIHLRSGSVVVEGSVAASFEREDIPFSVLLQVADLFAWSVDFSSGVWPGDRIDVLWEELWVKNKPYKSGRILISRFRGATRDVDVFHQEIDEQDEWYHRNGRNVKAAFLRAPVHFTRISSKFTRSRFHPVLKRYRPHSGVDFAAPTGTPVQSVADGRVIGAGVMGGAGKAVRIKHRNGWITSYSHLSRIHVKRGQTVRQGQRIGLVGSTGYSTGPHLDYRIKVNGNFVDPLRINLPSGEPVPVAQRDAFEARVDWLESTLDNQLKQDGYSLPVTGTLQQSSQNK